MSDKIKENELGKDENSKEESFNPNEVKYEENDNWDFDANS